MELKNTKFCASIVTYNPNMNILEKNIEAVFRQVEIVYIFDNGSINIDCICHLIKKYNNVCLKKSEKNEGLSYALNVNCETALNNNFGWILLLDQDSIIDSNLVNEYSKWISDDVGQITSYHTDRNISSISEKIETEVKSVEWCITSGTLMNLDIWNDLNRFDNSLFIDSIDVDYGITIRENGYKTLKIPYVGFSHEVGQITKVIKLFGRRHPIYNHSVFRKYYIFRNAIYVARKHKTRNTLKTTVKVFARIIFEFIFEKQKFKKLKSSLKGVRDGFKMEVIR